MSIITVDVVKVDSVESHPNADRLEVATVRGAKVVVGKGSFVAGSPAVYFPPDILIPDELANRLGVTKYLKHADYEGSGSSQCRVAGCRLRGVGSYGFLTSLASVNVDENAEIGYNLTSSLGAKKYTPPVRVTCSDAATDNPLFHRYTDIENITRYPNAIPDGTPVRVTEKAHGSNVRIGLIPVDGAMEFMAGSHALRRKRPLEGKVCMYWEPLDLIGIKDLLALLSFPDKPAIIFGEAIGSSVQDLDYGYIGHRGFRIFDISVDGKYLSWFDFLYAVGKFNLTNLVVPLLYTGPFSRKIVDDFTSGSSFIGNSRGSFKDREGVVITPIDETYSDVLGGRMILKSISADYLDRKNAQDNE